MTEDNVTFSKVEQVEAKDRPAEEKQTPSLDVEALKQSIVSEVKTILVENQKHEQGLRKKMENRVVKTMNDIIAAQRAAGVEMTQEQSQILESQVRQQVEADDSQVEDAPTPQKKEADKDPIAEFVNKSVEKIYAKAGFGLGKNDPEAEGLDKITDADDFIIEVSKRVAQKAERIKVKPETQLPGMGAGYTPGSETEGTLAKKLIELLNSPEKDWVQIKDVKAKLSKFNK